MGRTALPKALSRSSHLCASQDLGMLSVSDPVHRFLPDWREGVYGSMTLVHLLTHTSGCGSAAMLLPS